MTQLNQRNMSNLFGLVVTSTKVVCYSSRREWRAEQVLYREYRLLGILVWRKALDREEVPSWALIEAGALGSTAWRSKFSDIIGTTS